MQELHLCDCDPSHSEGDNNAISFIIYNSLASVSECMQCPQCPAELKSVDKM